MIEYRDVTVTATDAAPAGLTILDRISLRIGAGERVAYLGRSGAGKTTALRLINALVTPASGTMLIDGSVPRDLVALRRGIGYVLQQPALFPHRTVLENVATVPRLLGWDEARVRARAEELMGQLELPLDRFASRYPRMLSGGEQQRVAIARALIAGPRILLCDEPFSALDPLIREELQGMLVRLAVGGWRLAGEPDVGDSPANRQPPTRHSSSSRTTSARRCGSHSGSSCSTRAGSSRTQHPRGSRRTSIPS